LESDSSTVIQLWVTIMTKKQRALTGNVMESLVNEEVAKQLKKLPPRLIEYIHPDQVVAYALNRLPSLYATSEKGWHQQWQRGKSEMQDQITTIVRQGFAAVQRDPLRHINLQGDRDLGIASVVLQDLRELLQSPELDWQTVVPSVEKALMQSMRGKVTWKRLMRVPQTENYNWDSNPQYSRQ
jgi:hypothetical protein